MRRNISNRGRAVFCNSRDIDSSVASLLMFMVVVDDDESDFCLASSDVWREVNAVIVTMNISLGVIPLSLAFLADVVPPWLLRRRCSSIAVSINAEQQAALRTLDGSRAGPTVRISVSIFWKFCATSSGVSWVAREYSESDMDDPPERKVPNPSDELADDDIDEERTLTLLLIMEALLPDRERVII